MCVIRLAPSKMISTVDTILRGPHTEICLSGVVILCPQIIPNDILKEFYFNASNQGCGEAGGLGCSIQ
jgi:hypothetical protein